MAGIYTHPGSSPKGNLHWKELATPLPLATANQNSFKTLFVQVIKCLSVSNH